LDLNGIHSKHHVRPVEHALVDAHASIFLSASRPYVQILALAKDSLGGGATMAIEAADEEDVLVGGRMGHQEFGVILTTSPNRFQSPESTMKLSFSLLLFALTLAAWTQAPASQTPQTTERHLRNIRQLTHAGENAEAYFSPDGSHLIFQSTRDGYPCDQIYTVKIDGTDLRKVSTGKGRTTCGYFYPGSKQILFASTHEASPECPPKPSYERGYVWPIYAGYDIYRANPDGSNLTPLTRTPGYDAEATIAPDGLIVFTSVRDGDMEIYSMKSDGSDVKRLTNRPGPDG